jgi:hypothetical protein
MAAQLVASRVVLCSTELVSYVSPRNVPGLRQPVFREVGGTTKNISFTQAASLIGDRPASQHGTRYLHPPLDRARLNGSV